MRIFSVLLLCCLSAIAADWFPVAVWYGGGKARAPMLESGARTRKEVWRKDIRQIKALGSNTVRTWIDWATGEPREGQYNFENLEVILELAEEEGLRVFLQVYMDSAPFWVGRKYPDSLFVSANGMAVKPESSPGYCMDHPRRPTRGSRLLLGTGRKNEAQQGLCGLGPVERALRHQLS